MNSGASGTQRRQQRFGKIVATLNELGYVVHEHALHVFKSHLGLAPISETLINENGRDSIAFAPLRGTFFELWYPRLFQGKQHGQIADDYFRLFGTQACLIGNPVEWPGLLQNGTYPFFMDQEGRVRCDFFSFGSHYLFPTLEDYILRPKQTCRHVSLNDPNGTYDSEREDLCTAFVAVRPTVLAFYDRLLYALSWQPQPIVDMGEDLV